MGRADHRRRLHAASRSQRAAWPHAGSLAVTGGCNSVAQTAVRASPGRLNRLRHFPKRAYRTHQAQPRSDHQCGHREPANSLAMNPSLTILELAVLALGLALLLVDLWTAPERKRFLGYGAAAALGLVLAYSFVRFGGGDPQYAFGGTYVMDGMALFFKRFFLVAAIIVLLISVEFSDRILAGVSEYYALIVFALAGMMFAASANDFTMLFVSVELV